MKIYFCVIGFYAFAALILCSKQFESLVVMFFMGKELSIDQLLTLINQLSLSFKSFILNIFQQVELLSSGWACSNAD